VLTEWFHEESARRDALASSIVVPDPARCVQCGICSYNCPIGIDVRRYASRGIPVGDSRCLTCGECVARCPRGTLRFERSPIFELGSRAVGKS
jgi:ferredoxin